MARKLTKLIKERIAYYATQLPVEFMSGMTKTLISGEDVLLCNITEVDGKPVDKNGQYLIDTPIDHMQNHASRMENLYVREGKDGVFKYIRHYIEKTPGPANMKEEVIRALREEIFSSGNFEVDEYEMRYAKVIYQVRRTVSMIRKNQSEFSKEEVDGQVDRMVSMLAGLKHELNLSAEDPKRIEIDLHLDKVYSLIKC